MPERKNCLFSPHAINGIVLRNRFVLPAMQRGWGADYAPSKQLSDYYRRCVEGGVSLVISESTAVDHPSALGHDGFMLMLREQGSAAWKDCIAGVKQAGGRFLVQLWHEGATRQEGLGGPNPTYPTLSPSGLLRSGQVNGREATVKELLEIQLAYVDAALLAQRLGADGVEIHGAHGYFLDQFLWHETNLRIDEYGGASLDERLRYPVEVVRLIRDAVGPQFLISFRFSQWKEVDYEARTIASPDELKRMLAALREAGVDIFHPSTRRFYDNEWPGSALGLAGWTKSLTDADVIAVGSVGLDQDVMDTFYTEKVINSDVHRSIELIEAKLENGEFDLIAVGRSIMGDPAWVNKVREGRYQDIIMFKREIVKQAISEWDDTTIRSAYRKD